MEDNAEMMEKPLISVIVPIYNVEPYVNQALSSIRNQSYENLEIICLDDGSTDNSLSAVCAHAENDDRIKVITKANEGYGATCNRGLDEAQGTWVAVFEPDDWADPGMYEAMIRFASSLGEKAASSAPGAIVDRFDFVDVIKTPYWREVLPDTPEQRHMNCNYKGRVKPSSQPFSIEQAPHLLAHHPSIWSALYRRDFLNEKGIRFMEFPGSGWADNPFLYDTLCQAGAIAYLDVPYYHYREETFEKAHAFLQNNPLLPFERWGNMKDALDRSGVSDAVITEDLNRTGFTYLENVRKALGDYSVDVLEAAGRMFLRMDESLVLSDPVLTRSQIELFCSLRGLKPPHVFDAMRKVRNLASSTLFTLKANGVGGVIYEMQRYRN